MKSRFVKKGLFVFLALGIAFGMVACTLTTTNPSETTTTTTGGTSSTSQKTVTSISLLDDTPDPFYAGEFSPASVTVVVHYDDDTTEQIPLSLSMLSLAGIGDLEVPGTHMIVITYEGCQTSLTVEVLEPEDESVSLTFDLGGGTLAQGVEENFQNLISGTDVTLPWPTRPGYQFLGWYEDLDWEYGPWFDSFEVNSDLVLHAKWIELATFVASVLDEIISAPSYTSVAYASFLEYNDRIFMEKVTTQTYLWQDGRRIFNSVTDRYDFSGESPVATLEYRTLSLYESGEYRYVYERFQGGVPATFTRVDLSPKVAHGGVELTDIPYGLLDPAAFEPTEMFWGYEYNPVGDELVQFVHAIYDGDFLEDEVFLELDVSGDDIHIFLGIPFSPFDETENTWSSMLSISIDFSYFGLSGANFLLEEAKAVVMDELSALLEQRIATEFPTEESLTAYHQVYSEAEAASEMIYSADQLYEFYQTQLTVFTEFVLIPDPVKLKKNVLNEQIDSLWGLWSEIATDASLVLMTAEYDAMMTAIEAASTEAEADQAFQDGMLAIQLEFVEEEAKAGFVKLRTEMLGNLTHLRIMVLSTVSPADSGYAAVISAIDAAEDTISAMTYPGDPSTVFSTQYTEILNLYHLCTPIETAQYRDSVIQLIDKTFFDYVTREEEYLWEAMMLFSACREATLSSLASAISPEAVWQVLISYLNDCRDIADEEWRDSFLESYFEIFNYDFFFRVDSAYSTAFAEDYVIIRDRMTGAVMSEIFPVIHTQFLHLLGSAVLNEVKNARQDAFNAIDELLIARNPIATSESQTDIYNAMNAGHDALYAATTLGEVSTALADCLAAIEAAYVMDPEKAALKNARDAATAELDDYLEFTEGFVSDYAKFDEILLIGFEDLLGVPGNYTVAEVEAHVTEFYAKVDAVGFTPDAGKVETYRVWALNEIAEYLALLTTVPPEITDAYAAGQTAINAATDPYAIRDACEVFVSMVTPLL